MTALPQDEVADLSRLVAELEQRLESSFVVYDQAITQQAALAQENARLQSELATAREREAASAEILRTISEASGEPERDSCALLRPARRHGPLPPRARARRLRRRLRGDPARQAGHDIVEQALTVLRNLEHRGATGAEPARATARASCPRSRTRSSARSSTSTFPQPVRTPWASPSCPTDGPTRPWAGSRRSPPRRASTVLGWREVPVAPPGSSGQPPATSCRPSASCSCRAPGARDGGHRPRPPRVLPAQARRTRDRVYFPSLSSARSSTRAC